MVDTCSLAHVLDRRLLEAKLRESLDSGIKDAASFRIEIFLANLWQRLVAYKKMTSHLFITARNPFVRGFTRLSGTLGLGPHAADLADLLRYPLEEAVPGLDALRYQKHGGLGAATH